MELQKSSPSQGLIGRIKGKLLFYYRSLRDVNGYLQNRPSCITLYNRGQNYKLSMRDIKKQQNLIREKFLNSKIQPWHFCSYSTFCKLFPPPSIHEDYRYKNLSVIDMHLRFQQFIFQEMAPYKWIPGLIIPILCRFSFKSLIFPIFYVNLFDYYMKPYFIWKNKDRKIINIKKQFTSKLSKIENKQKRIELYNSMSEQLFENQEIPDKYLKFGEWTQYLFHATVNDVQQSSIYLTKLFETYMFFKTFSSEGIQSVFKQVKSIPDQFPGFKKEKDQCQSIMIDPYKLISYQDIRNFEKYNVTKNIQNRIRRFLQIIKYHFSGEFYMSGFTVSSLTHMNKHYDLLEHQKYNIDTNTADLALFFSVLAIPKFISFIIRRK